MRCELLQSPAVSPRPTHTQPAPTLDGGQHRHGAVLLLQPLLQLRRAPEERGQGGVTLAAALAADQVGEEATRCGQTLAHCCPELSRGHVRHACRQNTAGKVSRLVLRAGAPA